MTPVCPCDLTRSKVTDNTAHTLLRISLDMVKEHTETLFKKIGAAKRAEAVAIALRKHLLKA